MTTLSSKNSINRLPFRSGLLLITLFLACFALSQTPNAFGVTPAPDGGYPNGNTAEGSNALLNLTTGVANTAIGEDALKQNTIGDENTANGAFALLSNTTGAGNTANGFQALYSNTTGGYNTANGFEAVYYNTTGNENVADGLRALFHNTTGSDNTANGYGALYSNTSGHSNTANGWQALLNNTGSNNVGLGFNAGRYLTTDSGNVCIGSGVSGGAGESNTTRIRNVYSSLAFGRAVYVNSDNKIGTLVSSARFKEEIKPMDKASEVLLALKPVTFRYKRDIDPAGMRQLGLVAEDVQKVNPDLVVRDKDGKPYSVRYDQVNAMLLNEFLKEHRKVQELEANAE